MPSTTAAPNDPMVRLDWSDWEREFTDASGATKFALGFYATGKPVGSFGISFWEPYLAACITSKLQYLSTKRRCTVRIQNVRCSSQGVCCHFVASSARAREIFKGEVRQELLLMFAMIGRKIRAGVPTYVILRELNQPTSVDQDFVTTGTAAPAPEEAVCLQ